MIKIQWNWGWNVIALVLALSVIGCGDDDDNEKAGKDAAIDEDANVGEAGAGEAGQGGKTSTTTKNQGGGKGGATTGGKGGAGAGGNTSGGTSGGAAGTSAAGTSGTSTAGAAGTAGTAGTTATCAAGTACTLTNSKKGFCKDDTCTACTGPENNDECSTAYGSGSGYVCVSGDCVVGTCSVTADCATSGKLCGVTTANACGDCATTDQCRSAYGIGYVCGTGGSCVLGNCTDDSVCPLGQICGAATAYHCGACTADTQCKATTTYGANYICNTTANSNVGKCVSATCATNNQACSANAADFCCNLTCVTGNCCVNTDCSNNQICSNHTCTACAAAAGNTYYVDAIDGDDTRGTGNNAVAGCAVKTVGRALALIGNSPAAGTKILLLKGPVSTAETFPIAVPQNVLIASAGSTVTVQVSANSTGFDMQGAGSALENLDIYGGDHVAQNGVIVTSANTTNRASMTNVAVRNFAGAGISVTGTGALAIREGVSSKNNGTTTNVLSIANGLTVGGTFDTGTASVVITTSASSDTVAFNDNTGLGIAVYGAGSVTINGVPGSGGEGTVTANHNGLVGVGIYQTPGTEVPQNAITGLVAWGNGTGPDAIANALEWLFPKSGMVIGGGSSVILRDSYTLNNSGDGVHVQTSLSGDDDVTKIDLGKVYNTNPGRNTLQAAGGNNPNAGAGICLDFPTNDTAATLNAAGNVFRGTNCSTGTGALTKSTNCTGGVDVSVVDKTSNTSVINNIVVTNCSIP